MGQPLLVVVFYNRPGLDDEPEFRALFGLFGGQTRGRREREHEKHAAGRPNSEQIRESATSAANGLREAAFTRLSRSVTSPAVLRLGRAYEKTTARCSGLLVGLSPDRKHA